MQNRIIQLILFSIIISALFLESAVASAETLIFHEVLADAFSNSFDLKIAQEDISAGEAAVRETQAGDYPQISVRFGNDYVHAFGDQSDVASGGDVVIAENSSYRHSLITGLNYTLFDSGIHKLTVENARRQVCVATLQKKQMLWDTRKEVLRLYSTGLRLQKQLIATDSVLERQRSIYSLSKQLRMAGTLDQEQLRDAALNLAESSSELCEMKIQFGEVLRQLELYTRQSYSANEAWLIDLEPPLIALPEPDLTLAPAIQIYQTQIDTKQTELSLLKRALFPKLILNASHRMFGSDTESFSASLTELRARDAAISLTFDWPLFTGFADRAKKERLNHEINRLFYQKKKKQAELKHELSSATAAYKIYAAAEESRKKHLDLINAERTDAKRLVEQKMTDQISFQQRMIALTQQHLSLELRTIDYAAAALALNDLSQAMQ